MAFRLLLSSILVASAALAGCVQFQPVALYDGVEVAPVPERPRSLALAVEPVIYSDQDDDTIWFQDDARCTQGGLTDQVVYAGGRAVEVTWDRKTEGCEWAGLGFGWDGWAGKDLSQVLPYAAIQMRVRSKEGKMYGLPIVLTLEDYAGGMGFAYTDNKYFERYFIDEDWQSVTVPLADFDIDAPGAQALDLTNVKQVMFELQQSGSIYIDDVNLVWYEPVAQEPWVVLPERPDPAALPITLFDDAFINDDGWGLIDDGCQSIEAVQGGVAGSTALRARWDVRPEGCYEGALGVSWDQWYPADITSIKDQGAIQFDVKIPAGTTRQLPVRVALEDYGRQASQIILDARYAESSAFSTEWQTVTIPFTELRGGGRELAAAPATVGNLPAFRDGADFATIKQLVFYFDDAGEVWIDNLRLVAAD